MWWIALVFWAPADVVCTDAGASVAADVAAASGATVVHTGPCGACSTPRDLHIYATTRRDLTRRATACAITGALLGDAGMDACLRDIGFSAPCRMCWVENIHCTASKCALTCTASRLLGIPNARINPLTGAVELNDCLRCDEENCGPGFIACAGANRRRMGIVSDIPRPQEQIWQRR